jgi:TIR domain
MINEKEHYDVFLSYSHKDMAWVKEFATTLKNCGVTTWFDDNDIKPGDNWQEAIEQALRESNTLVLVLSQSNVNSPWTFFELGAAVADKKRIIPVLAGDIDISQVPLLVRNFQMLRTQSPVEAGKRVAEVIAA